jgi:hypothetical protein
MHRRAQELPARASDSRFVPVREGNIGCNALRVMRTPALFTLSLVLSGCLESLVPIHPPNLDEVALRSELRAGAYHGDSFRRVTTAPIHSELNGSDWVDVFITRASAAEYQKAGTGEPQIQTGTVIVRSVLDEAGNTKKLTVMAKNPAGYYPDGGDWLFGVTALDGTPLADDTGQPLWGRVAACAQCHESRRDHGWLFGVP